MKKGFTLIEVIAIIVILGIIGIIIVPTLTDTLASSRQKVRENQIETLEKAADKWVLYNENILNANNGYYELQLYELVESGLIKSEDIIDPTTNENLEGYIIIEWQDFTNQYKTEYFDYTEEEGEPS
ncbi:MAG: prepilin-type N-terminal cleavage/methylation domain-containing protein [Bacilli bacterium]|nr:prepilin-type N-terminal cleavage/methylation domain-containing protein [Bacilli bacterium]MDD4608368.1 prepilin-type N-terminal cleavage/methylation domain-containing protein [Bacilli bacterium]